MLIVFACLEYLQLFVGGICLIYVNCVCLPRVPPVVCRRNMSYLCYLCLFAYSGVQHILCVLRLVYHMLPVSLNCAFLIAPSVFSNVYLILISQ